MRSQQSTLLSAELTELQRVVLKRHDADGVFGSLCHIILSGPTGSGKSTVGEMFLTRPAVLNETRRRSLYIAPTRALAQAKHRDLLSLFAADPELREGCLLSTGEDTDHDWRIVHGRFSIACMVYEKAKRQIFCFLATASCCRSYDLWSLTKCTCSRILSAGRFLRWF